MAFLGSLFTWANAPYTIVLGIAVLFAMLQMSGVLGLLAGGGDHDADADADHDVDVDHDADVDADGDADHDADSDGDHDGAGAMQAFFADLGVGRTPLSILWQTFAVSFGTAGLAAGTVYRATAGALPTRALAWTAPVALVIGYAATRTVGRLIARLVSDPRQQATSRRELVGQTGVVISTRVDAEFGEVRVRDKTGHTVRVIVATRASEAPITEGREVVVVEHDDARDRLYVAPLELDAPPRERRRRRDAPRT